MLFFYKYSLIVLGILILSVMGCTQHPAHSTIEDHGTVSLQLNHEFNDSQFLLGKNYDLPNGEVVSGSILRYYVSNISFEKADGTVYVIPQDDSYFLIDESISGSKNLNLAHIPAGTYTGIRFTIGVDSLRSTMGLDKRKGVLDVGAAAQDMYWSWNSGYIHFKFEGSFTSSTASGDIRYHVGGFGGYSSPTINAVRTVRVSFADSPLTVIGDGNHPLSLEADLQKMFTGAIPFSVAENPSVMFSPFSVTIADNYATMFSIKK